MLFSKAFLLTLFTGAVAGPGYVLLDTKGKSSSEPRLAHAKARAPGYSAASLINQYYYYQINVGIGTPAQEVELLIDTGSSDLWVMDSSNPLCAQTSGVEPDRSHPDCSRPIIFDPTKSSTYHDNGTAFSIFYGDTSSAQGNYFQDTITLGDLVVTDATMALATTSNSSEIVFGIGYRDLEASGVYRQNFHYEPSYANFPILLKEQGYTDAVAYSLWLNDVNAAEGNLLFGGVDHAKYTGSLDIVPIINLSHYLHHPYSMTVMLHQLITGDCPLVQGSLPVLLDSGTSFVYLPSGIVKALADTVGYTWDDDLEFYVGACSALNDAQPDLTFDFSGKKISAPFTDFFLQNTDEDNNPIIVDGQEQCVLVIVPVSNDDTFILGDLFLRAAYIVYDLDNDQIGLAQAKHDTTDSDIEAITNGIPGGTSAASYASTVISTAYTILSDCPTPTSSGLSSGLSSGSSAASSIPTSSASAPASASASASANTTSNFASWNSTVPVTSSILSATGTVGTSSSITGSPVESGEPSGTPVTHTFTSTTVETVCTKNSCTGRTHTFTSTTVETVCPKCTKKPNGPVTSGVIPETSAPFVHGPEPVSPGGDKTLIIDVTATSTVCTDSTTATAVSTESVATESAGEATETEITTDITTVCTDSTAAAGTSAPGTAAETSAPGTAAETSAPGTAAETSAPSTSAETAETSAPAAETSAPGTAPGTAAETSAPTEAPAETSGPTEAPTETSAPGTPAGPAETSATSAAVSAESSASVPTVPSTVPEVSATGVTGIPQNGAVAQSAALLAVGAAIVAAIV